MEEYFEILSACPLFFGVIPGELGQVLACLRGTVLEIDKGAPVFLEGDPAGLIGVVLTGSVQIVREDYYGNRSVLTVVEPGDLFAEAFACAGVDVMPVSSFALQLSTVLLLDSQRILTPCGNGCSFHSQLLGNLLRVMARKNLNLTDKIRYMSQKTTREKLLAYLLDQAKAHSSLEFTIPYDRQGLADYLSVERSAMSAEIGKLRRDGILESRGAWFSLLQHG